MIARLSRLRTVADQILSLVTLCVKPVKQAIQIIREDRSIAGPSLSSQPVQCSQYILFTEQYSMDRDVQQPGLFDRFIYIRLFDHAYGKYHDGIYTAYIPARG